MRYDADHKERTRERVLVAAARSILADGPNGVGVADIMAKVGLTHGGFYAHFASKDEMVVATVDLMFDAALANLRRLTRNKTPAEAIAAYVDWYLSPRHRDSREAGCPMPALSGDLSRLGGAARRRFGRGAGRLIAGLAILLAAHGHADSEALAASAFAEMVGALLLARNAEPAESEAILAGSRERLKVRLLKARTSTGRTRNG